MVIYSCDLGPHSCRNEFIPGNETIQRADNHSIKGRSTNTLACVAVSSILWLWHICWHNCWFVRPWWRIHHGTPFPWNRNPSSGIFHSSFCHQVCLCRFLLETTLIGEYLTKVASATSILAMAFSASMAVVEYYLLKRFPVPYGKYA